jgi:MoxR-like ATPase
MLDNPPRRILLYGPPGTGKTSFALSLDSKSERITLTPGQFPDALLGKFLLKDGSTFWQNGPATRAALAGVPLVLDEINKAGPELDSTLQAILDDPSVCRINLDNGEIIKPADGFRIVATMNGNPDQLAEAVLDRFDITIKCDSPSAGLLERLQPDAAAFIVNKMANTPSTENWMPSISPRRMLTFCALRAQLGDEQAAAIVFGAGQSAIILNGIVDAGRNAQATS